MPKVENAPIMGAREWAMLLALSALWGGSFFFFKVLVEALPPFTVVLGRVGLAALALNLLLAARRDLMPATPWLWRDFAVMGLLNNVIPFTLIVFGETRISSGLASILNATTPIFGVVAAHLITHDEKLTWRKAAGVVCGFLGVVTLIGPGVVLHSGDGDILGEAASLGASISYALAGLYGRRFKGLAPLEVATGQISASTLMLIPICLFVDRPWTLALPGPAVWLAFAGISLLSTAAAYILYFRILATAGATNLLLVTFLLPVSAMSLGALFLGERVGPDALIGMALIGMGLAAIDGRALSAARGVWRRRRYASAG